MDLGTKNADSGNHKMWTLKRRIRWEKQGTKCVKFSGLMAAPYMLIIHFLEPRKITVFVIKRFIM